MNGRVLALWAGVLLSGCAALPPAKVYPLPWPDALGTRVLPPLPLPASAAQAAAEEPPARASLATTPRAYRQDGARHLYQRHGAQVYQGKLPPSLHAVGVLRARIGRRGELLGLQWMRAPRHAPEVVAAIERMMREAAPFPAPWQMGGVVYTDTWLWDASGRFQLDTLTEGQR